MSFSTGPGHAGGLWTHTPVDWAGNEGATKPASWPADAINGTPGVGGGQRPQGGVQQTITGQAATAAGLVTWTTPLPADSLVSYGPTTGYGNTAYSAVQTTAHSVQLSGLAATTTYHYRVSSAGAGYTGQSADGTFTTT